eukprot:CAMPEP_0178380668 /NCGR_PEP_ID=MMETSP0689_2-20121128/5584_1 /TAXON_ID=160604 /ORGANISM="Amphidinium massartii, Strain CS-259" /LENGTH=46 /DNA_ID= /DNA_START= /DNA_END= /DNA_ORIENTATION=
MIGAKASLSHGISVTVPSACFTWCPNRQQVKLPLATDRSSLPKNIW